MKSNSEIFISTYYTQRYSLLQTVYSIPLTAAVTFLCSGTTLGDFDYFLNKVVLNSAKRYRSVRATQQPPVPVGGQLLCPLGPLPAACHPPRSPNAACCLLSPQTPSGCINNLLFLAKP